MDKQSFSFGISEKKKLCLRFSSSVNENVIDNVNITVRTILTLNPTVAFTPSTSIESVN